VPAPIPCSLYGTRSRLNPGWATARLQVRRIKKKKLRNLQLAAEKKLQKLKDKDSAGITGDDDDALH